MAKILGKMPWNKLKNLTRTTTLRGKDLIIHQFEDKKLAHYSYVAISDKEAIVVDPERDIQKYIDFAQSKNATIVGVLNTHPHADFASGHTEIHEITRATIYVGEKVGAEYLHTPLA
jgi:glyoxylase-like metal-dependent hydrolase (beta-lactamase superfamily II)